MKYPSGFACTQGMHDEIEAFDCDDPTYFHDLSYWHLCTVNEITSQQPAEKLGKPSGPLLKAEFYAWSSSCEQISLEEMEKINKWGENSLRQNKFNMFFPFTQGWGGRSLCQIWSWLLTAITYVSKFGLPAQCTRLTDFGSRVLELFSYKSTVLWQFLHCSEHRQACQLGQILLPILSPFLSRSKGKLMLESGVV